MKYNPNKNYIAEQVLTVSEDPIERIKQYCMNDDFLNELTSFLSEIKDERQHQFQLDSVDTFGIKKGDNIFAQADLSDKNHPKFTVWLMNDTIMFEGIDFDVAATVLQTASQGIGTDVESFVAVAGAFGKIARERKVTSALYFKKLDKALIDNYGAEYSINKLMESEFSGRAEAAGLNTFRRNIPKDIWRGVVDNLGNIIVDLGLTILTFGSGTAGAAAIKGGETAEVAYKATQAAKVGANASKLKFIQKFKSLWNGLSPIKKVSTMKKTFATGTKIKYISKNQKVMDLTIKGYKDGSALLTDGARTFAVSVDNLVIKGGQPGGLAFDSLSKLQIAGAFAAKKGADIMNNLNIPTSQATDGFNLAEVLGYYDTLAADPKNYVKTVKEQDAKAIANNLLKLKTGSGIFGNTTDQEELAIALLITSIEPEMCAAVSKYYKKIDPGVSVYDVLDDEIGGDLGLFVKAWWTGCTGESTEMSDKINQVYTSIVEERKEK